MVVSLGLVVTLGATAGMIVIEIDALLDPIFQLASEKPPYVAVIVWVPTGNVETLITDPPLAAAVPSVVAPEVNVTLPPMTKPLARQLPVVEKIELTPNETLVLWTKESPLAGPVHTETELQFVCAAAELAPSVASSANADKNTPTNQELKKRRCM